MKTVHHIFNDVYIRHTDEKAAELVKGGEYVYCPKHLFKTQKKKS